MAIGDIWEIRLHYRFLNLDGLNVYHYKETTALGANVTPSDLASWFWTVFDGAYANLCNAGCTFTQVDVQQVTGGFAIGSLALSGQVGALPGDPSTSFTSIGFRLNRATADSRHGYKRIGGLGDTQVSGNTWLGNVADTDAMRTAIAGDILDPALVKTGVLQPGILSTVLNGQPRIPPVLFPIGSVTFTGVTSQVSRKP